MKSLLKSLLVIAGLVVMSGIATGVASADTITYPTSGKFTFSGAVSRSSSSNVIAFGPDSFAPSTTFNGFIYESFDLNTLVTPSGKAMLAATITVPTAIPEPAAMILLGMGLAGVAASARRRHKARSEE